MHPQKDCSECDGPPSNKPVGCKVTSAEAGVIWQVMIWALTQAGNRAGKTRHRCEVMRPGARARLHTWTRLSPHNSTFHTCSQTTSCSFSPWGPRSVPPRATDAGEGGGGARHDAASQVGATIAARAVRSPLLLWRVWKHVRVFVAEGAVLDCGVFSCLGLGRGFRGSGFSRGAGLFARSVLKVSRADQELRVRGRAILARGPDVLSPAAGSGCVEGGVVGAGRVLTASTTDQGLRVRRRAILPSSGLYPEERRLGVSVLNPAAS